MHLLEDESGVQLPMHHPCVYPGGFAAKMMEVRWLALGEGPVSHVTLVL